jgi:hypothetical protein
MSSKLGPCAHTTPLIGYRISGSSTGTGPRLPVRASRALVACVDRRAAPCEVEREVLAVLGPLGVNAALADALVAELTQTENANSATEDAAVHAPWCRAPCFSAGTEELPERRMYVSARPRPDPDSRVHRRYTSALTIRSGYTSALTIGTGYPVGEHADVRGPKRVWRASVVI